MVTIIVIFVIEAMESNQADAETIRDCLKAKALLELEKPGSGLPELANKRLKKMLERDVLPPVDASATAPGGESSLKAVRDLPTSSNVGEYLLASV